MCRQQRSPERIFRMSLRGCLPLKLEALSSWDEPQVATVPTTMSTSRTHASVLLMVLMLVAVTASCSSGQLSTAVRSGQPSSGSSVVVADPAVGRTSLGSRGVESTAIAAENKLPGTASWRVTHQGHGVIEGFATKTYAAVGDTVDLHVSTNVPSFQVTAYRMGWYQGLGARQIWNSAVLPGHVQPACPVAPSTNMVSCAHWARSLTMVVTKDFVPGDYVLKLVGLGNAQSVGRPWQCAELCAADHLGPEQHGDLFRYEPLTCVAGMEHLWRVFLLPCLLYTSDAADDLT